MTESCVLPDFSIPQIKQFLCEKYALQAALQPLDGERDLNFLVSSEAGKFVFKISNVQESRDMLACQHALFELLHASDLDMKFSRSAVSAEGNAIEQIADSEGVIHHCRLVNWVEGRLFSSLDIHSDLLLQDLGAAVGKMSSVLSGFKDPAVDRPLLWNLQKATEILQRFSPLIDDPKKSRLLQQFEKMFTQRVLPVADQLRQGTIHNDANDNNIVVNVDGPWDMSVRSIIDFGDIVESWLVADAAVAAAYALLGKDRPLDAIREVVRGFHREFPVTEVEASVIYHLACMRLCMSVCICAHQKTLQPDNAYLSVSEQPAWDALEKLAGINPDFAHFAIREACGMEPVPGSTKIREWIRNNAGGYSSMVDVDLKNDPLFIMDTSVASADLPPPSEPFDPDIAERKILRVLDDGGFAAGIGKYDEYRLIYSSENFVDSTGHQRTLHIGIDVFMPAGSHIYAPLRGEVYGVADNNSPLDYGGTIILSHKVEHNGEDLQFYTLYGHLKPASVLGFSKGDKISAGDKIGEMGNTTENGNWAPHVHFEIITDMLGESSTFVGVGSHGFRETWMSLCPDPAEMLGLSKNLAWQANSQRDTDPEKIVQRIRNSRSEHLSPSLSLSYRNPIHMVRGDRQYMYDFTGRKYLDSVNNVPHVGHCHPRVAEASARQSRVLATNTRYLYSQIESYSERLSSLFPDPLKVVFLVNSGSEANDLALRLAMNFTRRKDRIVVDHAYHGNLGSLIDISPYKHNRKGGQGAPSHVHTAIMPDPYRGPWRRQEPDMLSRYLDSVSEALDNAHKQGGAACFIAESIPGCGGQIVLPEGYLKNVYQRVRQAGGLCIADEVQVGFGRAGSHAWAFETQDVIPDIVTLGKPIGNGHPLAAVITTSEIAKAFCNGMEYFNTFGGNPVSCAVGEAVLDVLEDEELQKNALDTGNYFTQRLASLQETHAIIGDVRGPGLFIGIELVSSRETLDPAFRQASYVSERMRQKGILVSTDGPLDNVIKIKPPMCFNKSDADLYTDTLNRVLGEEFALA